MLLPMFVIERSSGALSLGFLFFVCFNFVALVLSNRSQGVYRISQCTVVLYFNTSTKFDSCLLFTRVRGDTLMTLRFRSCQCISDKYTFTIKKRFTKKQNMCTVH